MADAGAPSTDSTSQFMPGVTLVRGGPQLAVDVVEKIGKLLALWLDRSRASADVKALATPARSKDAAGRRSGDD